MFLKRGRLMSIYISCLCIEGRDAIKPLPKKETNPQRLEHHVTMLVFNLFF